MRMIIYFKVTLFFLSHCFAVFHTGYLLLSKKLETRPVKLGTVLSLLNYVLLNAGYLVYLRKFFKSTPNLTLSFSISQKVKKCNCKTKQYCKAIFF